MSFFRSVLLGVTFVYCAATATMACSPSYAVRSGDTLSGIAVRELGSLFAYRSIYEANRDVIGSDPDLIQIGMQFQIPCGTSAANPVNWAVLPSAQTIAALQKVTDIQILDIRRAGDVANGVIPGAISVPYSAWRGPRDNRSEIPTVQTLSQIVGDAGLQPDKPVLIVHSRPTVMDKGRAALVYWMLKSTGFETLAVLQDGFTGWSEAGLPIADSPITLEPYEAELLFSPAWRADMVDVYGVATSQITGFLLDARPAQLFSKVGDDGQALATTLPRAQSAPVMSLLDSFGPGVPIEIGVAAMTAHLDDHNADWRTGEVVMFCQTGELSALSWFYASELAGMENISLYPESIAGWSHDGGKLFAWEAE
jgi:thiosulfate/3-mercaptopyruvate sulfurtransferase